uniref:Uncharacterized protein n=1 Tax=Trichuris muris TaxID=70415 RepID=A0A5S6R1Z7_TRIMR
MNQQGILAECSDDESYNPGKIPSSTVWAPEKERAISLLETIKHYGYEGLPKLECPVSISEEVAQQPPYGCSLATGEPCSQETGFPSCPQTGDFWKQ